MFTFRFLIISYLFQIEKLPKELVKASDLKIGIAILANLVCRKLCCKLALVEEFQKNADSDTQSEGCSVETEYYEPSLSGEDCENRVEQHLHDLKTV